MDFSPVLQVLFENSAEGILAYDQNQRAIHYVNKKFLALCGLKEVSYSALQQQIDFENLPENGILTAISKGQNQVRFHKKSFVLDGVEYELVKLHVESNQSWEERISFFLGNIDEVVFAEQIELNGDRSLGYVSPKIEELSGVAADKFLSGEIHPFGICHEKDLVRMKAFLEKANKARKSGKLLYRLKNYHTDDFVWVELSFYPQVDTNGLHYANFGILRDVSRDIEADQLLRQSELKHRMLFSRANDAIMILKDMEMVDCNEKTLSMFGAEGFVDVAGTKLYELMPEKQPDGTDSILAYHYHMQAAKNGEPQFFYWRHAKLTGEQFDSEVSISGFSIEDDSFVQVIVRDITIRLQAEEQKNQSIKSYFEIFNYSSDLIFVIDNSGAVRDVNQSVLAKYNTDKSNIVGKAFDELGQIRIPDLESDDLKHSKAWNEDTQRFDWWCKTPSGKECPLEMVLHPGTYFGEEVIIASGRDISERLNYEANILESENRFRTLASRAPIGIFLTNQKGEAVYVNEMLKDFSFFPSTNGFMRNWLSKVHPEDQEKVVQYYERDLEEIDHYENEYRVIRKKHDERWVKVQVNLLKGQDGKPTGRVGIVQDITHQKISAKKIRESERNYRQLVEILPDSVVLHSEEEVVYSNPAGSELLGISDPLKTYSFLNYLQADHRPFFQKAINQAINLNKNSPYFEVKMFVDGHKLDVEVCCLPFVYHGQKVAKLVIHDISARKMMEKEHLRAELAEETNRNLQKEIDERLAAEEELKEKEKQLKESVHQKVVLLKEVHHRVKNNLQVISSILKLQSNYVDDPSTLDILTECQDRVKSMAFIHESLYQSADLAQVNFTEYLQNLCSNIKYSYAKPDRKIDLNFDIEPISLSLDSAIPCGLIVNELVSNCFKYAFKNQKTGTIWVQMEKKGNEKLLVVRDSGSGMPQDLDFRNTDSLGLQLVCALVDQIDGEINYEYAAGSRFVINFKRA